MSSRRPGEPAHRRPGARDPDRDHAHDHSPSADHPHSPSPDRDHAHDHGHSHDHAHGPGHAHDHGHSHDHAHGPGHSHDHAAELRATPTSRLAWAFGLTVSFMVVEAAVGIFSQSLALIADAGHMLADAAALGLALIAQRIARRARTRSSTYGYRRAEVLAAFANGTVLALTAAWIAVEAVERWQAPKLVHGKAMMITAALGLGVNLVSAAILRSGTHNPNTRAALAHVLSDALGSVGAIVAGILVMTLGLLRADPVIGIAIGLLVAWSGVRLVRDTTRVLMEGTPPHIDLAEAEASIRAVPGVSDVHDLHVWSISEGFDLLTVHVVIARGYHGTDVAAAVGRHVKDKLKIEHCTVQPEAPTGDVLIPLRRRPAPTDDPRTGRPRPDTSRADPPHAGPSRADPSHA
ncbi:MAG: cation diffusion facilitator family transporter [Polyangiaceae bacterium]